MKEKPTVGSPFFRVFPSDCIHKATNDVSVHFFIHSYTFMDELIMDDALAVRKTSSITFPLSLLTQNFLHRGGGSDDFHSEDCHFVCASYRKHHVLSPEIMLFFVFISHIDEVTKNSRVSFCSCINIWGTKCWQTRQMFNTSWRILWQLLTEILPFDVVWFTDFLLSLLTIYYRCSTFASFVDVDGWPLCGSLSALTSIMAIFMPVIHHRIFHASFIIRLLQHG